MTDKPARKAADIPAWLWLGLPAASVLLCAVAPVLTPDKDRWLAWFKSEMGLLQNMTVLLLVPAMVLSVLIFLRRRELPRLVGLVMLLGGLAAVYFAGEEISWGQTYFGFRTPEALAEVNEQREFNLHNLRGMDIFSNVPRQAMMVACIAGGVLPLVLRKRLSRPEARRGVWYWLIPTWRLVPIALLAAFSTVPEKLIKLVRRPAAGSYLDLAVMEPGGEFKEYCFALVMLLYLLSVYLRMGPRKPKAA